MPKTVQHDPVWSEHIDITPAVAAKWIDDYNIHNREIRDWRVKLIQRDMENARYYDAGENGITIDWDNNIAGGQHTLYAIVASGRTVHVRVTHNVDPIVRDVLNDTLKERLADRLYVAGVKSSSVIEALLRRAVFYDVHGGLIGAANAKYSKADLMSVWPKYAQPLIETIEACSQWDSKDKWPGNRGAMVFAYWAIAKRTGVNLTLVNEFFDKICYGSSADDEKILFNRLRVRLNENPNANTQAYWVFRAWNAFSRRENLTILQAPRDSLDPVTKKMILTNKHFLQQKPYKAR